MHRNKRIALAETYLDEGRITQGCWRTVERGREMVCALAAFGRDINAARDCPAELMPQWLAYTVPKLDDYLAPEHIPILAYGLIDRAKRWDKLSEAAWERIEIQFGRCTQKLGWKGNELCSTERHKRTLIAVHRLFTLIDEELEKLA